MGILTEKSYFCALSVTFLRLVCILKLENLLQGYVKWKNTMTFNVNFSKCRDTKCRKIIFLAVTFLRSVHFKVVMLSNVYGLDIDRKIIFLCPLRYIFEAGVHFKVGKSPSRLC